MFEHRSKPLLSKPAYYRRIFRHLGIAISIILGSLAIGIIGYHYFAGFGWIDSLLNASMILAGMGPVTEIPSTAGKLFASFYALYSGVAFITTAGVVFAPVFHRFLHKFHLDITDTTRHKEKPDSGNQHQSDAKGGKII
jgi:hypothetical protein